MVVMVNQTGARTWLACGMGFAFFFIMCPLATSSSEQRHHPKSVRERGDWWGFSPLMQGLKSNTGRFKSWDVDLEARRSGTGPFSVQMRIRHLPFIRGYSSPLLFTACTQKMQRRRIRQGVVLPRLMHLAYVAIIKPSLCLCKTSRIIIEFCLLIVHGCALGLTGEVESDRGKPWLWYDCVRCVRGGRLLCLFSVLAAQGHQGLRQELGDEFIERRKVSSVKLRVSKILPSVCWVSKKHAQSEDTEVQQLKRTNTLSAWRVTWTSLNRTTISKKAVRKQTRKTMRWTVYMTILVVSIMAVVCGVLRYRIRELYAIDGW